MKKNILKIVLLIVVWDLLGGKHSNAQELIEERIDSNKVFRYYKEVLDSNTNTNFFYTRKNFSFPLLKKVFPEVEFYFKHDLYSTDNYGILMANIGKEKYYVLNSFNKLLKKCNSFNKASIEEIIETIIKIENWYYDTTDYKVDINQVQQKLPPFTKGIRIINDTNTYNYKAVFKNKSGEKTFYYLIENNLFKASRYYNNENDQAPGGYFNDCFEENKNINIEINEITPKNEDDNNLHNLFFKLLNVCC